MASGQMVKEVIWRGAWLLVRFTDERIKKMFLKSTITVYCGDKMIAFGPANLFWDKLDEEKPDSLMLDVSEIVSQKTIPDRIKIICGKNEISLPVTLTGEEDDLRDPVLAVENCLKTKELG